MTLNPKSEAASAIAERKAKAVYMDSVLSLLTEGAIIVISLVLIFSLIFGIHIQKGQDMYPAIKDGDIVLYLRTHKVLNTEAVVYKAEGKVYTGRVEASAGTVISATGDLQMTFDGNYLPISKETGIYTKTYAHEGTNLPMTVEDGYCFILGDSRDSAKDSRVFGQINKKNIKGRIVTVLRRRQI